MSNITQVTVTNGQGTSGTGTVSTLDNLIGVAGTPSAQVQSVQGVSGGTAVPVSGTVTANAGTNLNTSALALESGGNLATLAGAVSSSKVAIKSADGDQATIGVTTGTAVITDANGTAQQYLRGMVKLLAAAIASGAGALFSKITDGTNTAAVKAASTAPLATDPALVVAISPNSINANGLRTPANSAPVVNAKYTYNTVAASQTAQALTGGSGGATGDTLVGLWVVPAATTPGVVTILDNATSINAFAGSATFDASLRGFYIDLAGIASVSGAWKVTTGASVSVIAIGSFT